MHDLNLSHNDLKKLINQLKHQGMEEALIFGFIMTLKSCFFNNPDIDHLQINDHLPLWGWNDFKLDYSTFQIVLSCFQAECGKPVRLSG